MINPLDDIIRQREIEARLKRQIAEAIEPMAGTTAERPAHTRVGRQFFDTTLGKPIWLKTPGETPVWVDATGTTV